LKLVTLTKRARGVPPSSTEENSDFGFGFGLGKDFEPFISVEGNGTAERSREWADRRVDPS